MPRPPATPEIVTGTGALTPWSTDHRVARAVLLVDAALEGSPLVGALARAAEAAGARVRVHTAAGAGTAADAHTTAVSLDGDAVIAVGGGAVMDRAKLANVVAGGLDLAGTVAAHDRSGLLRLPDGRRGAPLVAVPTTVGTGSEMSANAVVTAGDRRLLISGPGLGADLAVLDPAATASLPRQLLLDGAFEAFNRTVGPYVGGPGRGERPDQIAEAVAARLVVVGERISSTPPSRGTDAADRAELARLSGMSHTPAMHLGRDPFGFRGWYVGHEVSTAADVSKVRGLATVTPGLWARVLEGDRTWGDTDRLLRIWAAAARAVPGVLPEDPVAGVRCLAERWGIRPVPPDALDTATVADTSLHHWGRGLPGLDGLTVEDVRAVVAPEAVVPV
ncbi:daptide-type RiPP biosynthesis dehydogenase [Nocardiopsis halotolerans]|uniref:daptide-type RiPP biosynthesis dehydogenase n=1 Tax=Nocardiopsis halotolerans TaxID=124252 RepID=UPI000345CDFD|nr:daptide-type RiPP biosynthesis dehydogenase [Nocardiopsis halotolerans]